MFRNNTIVAIATPPGRGGIGVVRVSGLDSLFCARKILLDDEFSPIPNQAYVRSFFDPLNQQLIDNGVLTYYKAPRSFTGEDVVELSCHGSPVVLSRIVDVVTSLGIRSAKAGEFAMQAVFNKKFDLSQAEAIRDLINAHSRVATTQALRQLSGELSSFIQPIQNALLQIIVSLESSLEFVEEDLPDIFAENTKQQILSVKFKVEDLISTFSVGKFINSGYKVVLVGRPNVGKSSIFNALLSYDRAIVTDVPGTTRDSVSEHINLNDIPVILTDTAGMREPGDVVEKLGIERTYRVAADADLILIVLDGSIKLTAEDHQVLSLVTGNNSLIVVNKLDRILSGYQDEVSFLSSLKPVFVSALTGEGFDILKMLIDNSLNFDSNLLESNCLITNERHHDLLKCVVNDLDLSIKLLEARASEEITLIGLHNALRYLGEITGETTSDDILGEIFATFCIGK